MRSDWSGTRVLLLACCSWVAVQRRPHAATFVALLLLVLCRGGRPLVLLLLAVSC
jgi:hypothetical protein